MSASKVQIDDGDFTRLHNEILERLALARFTASEYRCLMFLFRMTYGWQKKEDVISLSQWAVGVGIDPEKRHNVLRTLQGLIAKNVIYTQSNGNNRPSTWGFNKYHDQWDKSLFDETVISHDNSSDAQTVISHDNSFSQTVISHDNKTVISRDNHQRKKESTSKKGAGADLPKPEPQPPPRSEFVMAFERIWGTLVPSEYIGQKIHDWEDRIPLAAWEYGLRECADRQKAGNWRYLEPILVRLEQEGYASNGVVESQVDFNLEDILK